ncbi:MAG: hypothetical protein HBSAPP03_24310 [Phycisphaerae bacterium]|nr:MAG: hypothetical protein HBSAPP03_24310 [Phycisphaerae bacterium]
MTIVPLPQFEADVKAMLEEEDRAAYAALKAPKSLVVRFGALKYVGEFPYAGDIKPGCGSKIVVRTFRGTEIGEMLTSTCPNAGCSKSVSRQEMLRYIENSGGRDYPFYTEGRALRVATKEDLDAQAAIEQSRHELRLRARAIAERLRLAAKIVDVEPILGGESVTVFYLSEERVELRDLARELGHAFRVRVDLKHVGARDEARITADYEKCGQYCCCKNFLKVLKPVSMKSAKVQKATLDPLKISGRCGRLMCCLRYEDSTYEELRKRLPRKKTRVGTPEGDGLVLDGQILTQLVLVELDALGPDGKIQQVAVPVENLTPPTSTAPPSRPMPPGMMPGGPGGPSARPGPRGGPPRPASPRPPGQPRMPGHPDPRRTPSSPGSRPPQASTPAPNRDAEIDELLGAMEDDLGDSTPREGSPGVEGDRPDGPGGPRRKRRRRRRGGGGPRPQDGGGPSPPPA